MGTAKVKRIVIRWDWFKAAPARESDPSELNALLGDGWQVASVMPLMRDSQCRSMVSLEKTGG